MPRGFIRYSAYTFQDHDPVLDVIDTMRKESGLSFEEVQAKGGATAGTLRNWRKRKVKRPQFTTVAASARAMGYDTIPLTATGRAKLKRGQ